MLNRVITAFYCVLICSAALQAQGGITVKAAADKNKILIGEPLQLTFEINFPAGTAINFPAVDSMAHFEVAGKPVTDTVAGNDITTVNIIWNITSFDSGSWVIPAFDIAAGIKTDSIPVEVVFSDFDPRQPYHDITDVEDVPVKKKKEPWWWYVAGAALLLLLFVLLFRKKKPSTAPVVKKEKFIDPYEEAIRQLDKLTAQPVSQKEYYSALTDIFRLYIFRKKGVLSLQKTTDDLVVQLKGLDLDKERFDKLSQALRMSDFVKFAKYVPTATDDKNCLDDIRQAIMIIEQKEQSRLAEEKSKR